MNRRQPGGGSWAQRLGRAIHSWFEGAQGNLPDEATTVRFRLLYERFREILSANDTTLELIADIEESLAGDRPFSIDAFAERVRTAALNAFVMVKDLNLIDDGRHTDLYEALKRINAEIEAELPEVEDTLDGPAVLSFDDLTPEHDDLVGPKMANLARIRREVGLPVPGGFVVTAAAYSRVMTTMDLWPRIGRLGDVLTSSSPQALAEACAEVQSAIRSASVPEPVLASMLACFDQSIGPPGRAAVRSSTLGEDKAASHAGQYTSLLGIRREGLLDAYREVVASVCSPSAVAYRVEHGVLARETWMAVGVMEMVEPRCSGIMFSRDFHASEADRVVVAATPGLAAGVASGTEGAYEIVLEDGQPEPALPAWLDSVTIQGLRDYARRLEVLFGTPQDIEWALSRDGVLYVLQSRPMRLSAAAPPPRVALPEGAQPLLSGGLVACRGLIAGPVHVVHDEASLDDLPPGAVLVARHSSPAFSRVMARCAAIVTEVGSPAGHMAILSREAGVPTIVGLRGALTALPRGADVTVDAYSGAVYAGCFDVPRWERRTTVPVEESPATRTLRKVAALVTPLNLIDPASKNFKPSSCRTLHDILRYVHETAFATMFHFGDRAEADRKNAIVLEARLPFQVLVYDVGGGVLEEASEALAIRPAMIASTPLVAFLEGMLDPRLRWDKPRPVSASGFMSVLGESMIGPPPESQALGRVSYVVCSDRYMNFSTKAGYHFSTVDTWCGSSVNKNYVHFRFSGGGAAGDRRSRRIECLDRVLSELDFKTQRRGDMLVARMAKYERSTIVERLAALGRLTICARQLDMLMDSNASPAFFANAFLAGEFEKFF